MTLTVAAGIDAGKAFLDLAIASRSDRVRNRSLRVANTASGIEKILQVLAGSAVKRVILEAIGPYAAHLVRALASNAPATPRRRQPGAMKKQLTLQLSGAAL